MSDLLSKGAAMIERHRAASMVRTVSYTSYVNETEGTGTSQIPATIEEHDVELVGNDGAVTRARYRDYVFARSDIIANADLSSITPSRGDRIQETVGGVLLRFEVCDLPGRPCFEFEGLDGERVRVHTRQRNQPT